MNTIRNLMLVCAAALVAAPVLAQSVKIKQEIGRASCRERV